MQHAVLHPGIGVVKFFACVTASSDIAAILGCKGCWGRAGYNYLAQMVAPWDTLRQKPLFQWNSMMKGSSLNPDVTVFPAPQDGLEVPQESLDVPFTSKKCFQRQKLECPLSQASVDIEGGRPSLPGFSVRVHKQPCWIYCWSRSLSPDFFFRMLE